MIVESFRAWENRKIDMEEIMIDIHESVTEIGLFEEAMEAAIASIRRIYLKQLDEGLSFDSSTKLTASKLRTKEA